MSLEFHLTQYERYRKEGLEAHQRGDRGRARFALLKAAEHLYRVAESSEGRLQRERARRAAELVELARRVENGERVRGGSRPTVAREDEDRGGGDGDNGQRYLIPERPSVRFDAIAGLESIKEEIRLKIIYPYQHPELAQQYGVHGGGGILFYGPPGTGKTLMARAVAGEVDCPFFTVKPSEVLSKWVGEAEKNLASLFAAARAEPRAVIFIDEIEALAPARADSQSSVMQRLVPQILAELEGFSGRAPGLLFLGATNEPWSLDPAILRPGRFDDLVYVGLPDAPAVLELLRIHLKGRPLAADVDLGHLSGLLEGFSGADLRNVCRKAADRAFRLAIETGEESPIDMVTLLTVIRETGPSVSPEQVERFLTFRDGRARG